MNDILPKPFTKEGLLDMLEVSSSIDWVCVQKKSGFFYNPGLYIYI